ncbi:sigma 54-interacting transcriptional regulator [Heyndrickxia acidicola]|uniref:HTH-type transcriptional regulatory protein TyrR n=1 Tax=Heyndrickxia acidicola TaxID=209389 RepID=A0ABU6MHQ7_9BACI|nr:sigma 54-interacting transcriptional regulator [Heyndrickxia acidicola]MED1203928.1 sigma 54-interacting transcriptional regulator [Heyndrickxia acidicola]
MNEVYIIKKLLDPEVFDMVRRISGYPTTILIEGEVGAGKELMAKTIHHYSNRSHMPFVKINCSSLAGHLSETELFDTGSPSVPIGKKQGFFDTVNEGSLFLDEVGELNPRLQAKLESFLQDREHDRGGGSWSKKLNIRILASSTVPLIQLVKEKKFRVDLYYRLNVAFVEVPPLRNRQQEIPLLLEYYLKYFCKEYNIEKWFKSETLEILKNYSFPGNILELRNLVEKLCVTINSEYILPAHLPAYFHSETIPLESLEAQIGQLEIRLIRQALEIEGSIRKAAARLQISHATLLRKMQKWDIKK